MKTIFNFCIFFGIAFPFLFMAAKAYDVSATQLKKEKTQWILNVKNGHYDIAFLGSSRVLNIVDPLTIDSILSKNTINIGEGGASYPEQYLLLQEFLKNNTLKTLCIQADMWGFMDAKDAYGHGFSEEKYLHLIGNESVDSIYLKNSSGIKFYFRKYFPFFKYAEYNSIYPMDRMLLHISPDDKSIFERRKGAYLINEKKKNIVFSKLNTNRFSKLTYNANMSESFKKIVLLAKSKKINIILFTSPSYQPFVSRVPFNKMAKDSILQIAYNLNLPFFDFEKAQICNDSNLFVDYTHLNYLGSFLFTKQLCDSLQNQKNAESE